MAIGEKFEEAIVRASGACGKTQGAEDCRGDQGRLRLSRQIDEEHAAGERVENLCRDVEGEPRLAAAADACDGQQALRAEELAQCGALLLATDERRALHRQIVGECIERPQRGELVTQIRRSELPDTLRLLEITEAM